MEEDFQKKYFWLKEKYFNARFNYLNFKRNNPMNEDNIEQLLELAEEYGLWKGRYSVHKEKYKHLITIER